MYTFKSILNATKTIECSHEDYGRILDLIERAHYLGMHEAYTKALEAFKSGNREIEIAMESLSERLDMDNHDCEYEVTDSKDNKDYVECTICGLTDIHEKESMEEMML